MSESKKCVQCGKLFERQYGEYQKRWDSRKFCSRECRGQSMVGQPSRNAKHRNRYILVCEACGKEFEAGGRTGKREGKTRFCSRKCAFAARYRTGSKAMEMSVAQAAYLAGMVDGEGSIMLFSRGKNAWSKTIAMRVSIANSNRDVLEWCVAATGVGCIVTKPSDNKKHKSGLFWAVNSEAAATVLQQIVPYLVIKAKQAKLAIDFQERLKTPALKVDQQWQEEYRQRMRAMNKRGPWA